VETLGVTAGIIEKEGKILLARRGKGEFLEGMWEFPGGKIENGESPEECLKRELKEEFGIDAEVGAFFMDSCHSYEHVCIRLMAYRVPFFTGGLVPEDHDRIAWSTPDTLLSFKLAPADIPIARALSPGGKHNLPLETDSH
jgi:8-oxo-dGTP diphosphatase